MPYRDIEHEGFKIVDNGTQTRRITTIGKGSLPKELRGMYSTSLRAQQAIDAYLGAKDAKKLSSR
jgi:hypothetical protein